MDKKNESGSDSGDGLGEVAAGEAAKGSDAGSDAAAEAAGFEQRIRELERQLLGVQGKYADRVLGEVLREAYLAQGGRPSASATAVLAMRAGAGISLNHKGEPVFAEADGEPLTDDDGVRLTAESFVRGWLSDNPIFLGKDAARGSGARQSESGEMSADEILRRIRTAKTAEEVARLAKELGLR
ncbi:MAG TPA: hypothetical protein VMX35_03320 [Acidobacteriota bacterium]|nr:hypothetical protein [Acidobacteriota bacterium]